MVPRGKDGNSEEAAGLHLFLLFGHGKPLSGREDTIERHYKAEPHFADGTIFMILAFLLAYCRGPGIRYNTGFAPWRGRMKQLEAWR